MSEPVSRLPSPVSRLPGWESRLAAYLREARTTPFAFGAHDCCLHAARALDLQHGLDLASDLRATYTDAAGARRILRARYRGCAWGAPEKHGLQAVPVKLAQRGAIMGAKVGRRRALGVCFGVKSYFVGRAGLVTIPTLDCERAWRLG